MLTIALGLSVVDGVALATPLPAVARSEVLALLAKLESSGCEFNRNGTWHTAREAGSHLARKLDYLERNGSAQNAEQFIDLAGTNSSLSGDAYQVRCPGAAPVPSSLWLTRELQAIRAAVAATPKP
ncbi:MAG: hypothetical protein FIA97_16320 [Methylococcaceae bacterium]|nr:hypothetical protein [Methylococcaceae bacterium]